MPVNFSRSTFAPHVTQQMVSIARRLEEEGKIFIERGSEGDGFI